MSNFVAFYNSRSILSAAFATRPDGVPVLWALLTYHGRFGAWPSVGTLRGLLRRPLGADRKGNRPDVPPRPISADMVQRALADYVDAGILTKSRRDGLRAPVYQLAEPYRGQLEGNAAPVPEAAPAESLNSEAADARPSSRGRAELSIKERTERTIPLPPTVDRPAREARPARAASGGGAPPDSPPVSPTGEPGRAAPRPLAPRSSKRPAVALDAAQIDGLLAWYAGEYARRYRRAYLPDRNDPRRIRTLLAWAATDGAADGAAWVRVYLRAFLRLAGGPAGETKHALDVSTRSIVKAACLPPAPAGRELDASEPAARSWTPPPLDVPAMSGAEIAAELARRAGRRIRRAAGA